MNTRNDAALNGGQSRQGERCPGLPDALLIPEQGLQLADYHCCVQFS